MPWQEASRRTRQFEQAREFLAGRKRWRRLPKTYTGFAAALRDRHEPLARAVWGHFRRQLPRLAPGAYRRGGHVVLAADGSRFECPRTPANEAALGCAGRRGTGPQVMLAALYHLGTGLPYAARVGPGTACERGGLLDMLGELPERTLLLADAGFVSYELCRELLRRGHSFLLRVGGNRELLTGLADAGGCEFGEHQQAWLWPQAHRKRGRPPLSLRLIEIETPRPGTPNVFLLTNLPAETLPDGEAEALYRERWGVEVFFRSAKQTLESRTLKSRTPGLARAEAEWLVLSVFLLGALAAQALAAVRTPPHRWSAAEAVRVVRRRMRHGHKRGGRWRGRLGRELAGCVVDRRPRRGPKRTRRHPAKKRDEPPRPPKVRPATARERRRSQRLAAENMLV